MASKKYGYVLTETAESDINEALSYIAINLGNVLAASSLADAFMEQIENFCLQPRAGTPVENELLKRGEVRYFLVKNYIVYYLVDDVSKKIVVLRFVYGKRNQDNILGDL